MEFMVWHRLHEYVVDIVFNITDMRFFRNHTRSSVVSRIRGRDRGRSHLGSVSIFCVTFGAGVNMYFLVMYII